MGKVSTIFWAHPTKLSVYLTIQWLVGLWSSWALCPLPSTTNKQANNTLQLCACTYSLRLVAKLFAPCQWSALTFTISCDFISKPSSCYYSHLTMSPADPDFTEQGRHSSAQMPVRVSGSKSQWLEHLLRALPDVISSSSLHHLCLQVTLKLQVSVSRTWAKTMGGGKVHTNLQLTGLFPTVLCRQFAQQLPGVQWVDTDLKLSHQPVRMNSSPPRATLSTWDLWDETEGADPFTRR